MKALYVTPNGVYLIDTDDFNLMQDVLTRLMAHIATQLDLSTDVSDEEVQMQINDLMLMLERNKDIVRSGIENQRSLEKIAKHVIHAEKLREMDAPDINVDVKGGAEC